MSQTATETIQVTHSVTADLPYRLDVSLGGDEGDFYAGTAGAILRKKAIHAKSIADVRGRETDFKLDTEGFQFPKHTSREKSFADPDTIKSIVYNETAELLKEGTGASHVYVFSHISRASTWESAVAAAEGHDADHPVQSTPPARGVHVDQSFDGAEQIMRDNLPAGDAAKLGSSRWAIINFWRPIHRPIQRDPLAVCDARSVDVENDLAALTIILPSKESGTAFDDVSKGQRFEMWEVRYNSGHQWYYCSEMTPDEVLMIKCFDSKKDGRARAVPHSAFQLPGQEGPARESIELRCLVFCEGKSAE